MGEFAVSGQLLDLQQSVICVNSCCEVVLHPAELAAFQASLCFAAFPLFVTLSLLSEQPHQGLLHSKELIAFWGVSDLGISTSSAILSHLLDTGKK